MNAHIRMGAMGKYPIPSLTSKSKTIHSSPMSDAVDSYYLGSPKHLFAVELESQLITGHMSECCTLWIFTFLAVALAIIGSFPGIRGFTDLM